MCVWGILIEELSVEFGYRWSRWLVREETHCGACAQWDVWLRGRCEGCVESLICCYFPLTLGLLSLWWNFKFRVLYCLELGDTASRTIIYVLLRISRCFETLLYFEELGSS